MIFLLGCDNNITPEDIPKDSFVVYIVKMALFRDLMVIKELNLLTLSSLLPHTHKDQAPMVQPILFSEHRRQSSDGYEDC